MDTERRRRPVGPVGGAVRDHRGGAREQCGLKQASMLRSFPYACLSLGISRPPCGENEAQNFNLQRFGLTLPDSDHAPNIFTLHPGELTSFPFTVVTLVFKHGNKRSSETRQ